MTLTNSVTVTANERRERRNPVNSGPPLPIPSDDGLLSGVTLFDYQKNIFAKMVKSKRAVCSMVMGSGKTLTTIACFAWIRKYHKPNARLLVICPKSLRIQWANEIKRVMDLDSTQVMRREDITRNTPVFIATYQWYAKNHEVFLQQNYDVLVADEIQYVRNSESKTWKALSKINTEYFYGLSGTVIENSWMIYTPLCELSPLAFLDPSGGLATNFRIWLVSPRIVFFTMAVRISLLFKIGSGNMFFPTIL